MRVDERGNVYKEEDIESPTQTLIDGEEVEEANEFDDFDDDEEEGLLTDDKIGERQNEESISDGYGSKNVTTDDDYYAENV